MYDPDRNCNEHDRKAFLDIVDLVGCSTVEQVWDMYCCASCFVQRDIESAVRLMIGQGNKAFSKRFPQLCNHA